MHRIFVGLKLPDTLHQTMAAWRMQHADWPVRWMRATDLHLTIVPPWEVDSVQTAVNAFYSLNGFFQPQTVRFNTIHFVPDDAPRMVWTEGQPTPELNDMKQRLHSVFAQPAEAQAFRPHITLARCWADQVQVIKQYTETVDWTTTCTALVLYESKRDQFGSRYKELAVVTA